MLVLKLAWFIFIISPEQKKLFCYQMFLQFEHRSISVTVPSINVNPGRGASHNFHTDHKIMLVHG